MLVLLVAALSLAFAFALLALTLALLGFEREALGLRDCFNGLRGEGGRDGGDVGEVDVDEGGGGVDVRVDEFGDGRGAASGWGLVGGWREAEGKEGKRGGRYAWSVVSEVEMGM